MKVFARKDKLYIREELGDKVPFKKVFRHFAYDNARKCWYVNATLASFVDALNAYPSCIPENDEETVKWAGKCRAHIRRIIELQGGIEGTDKRPVTLPTHIDYVWDPFPHQKEALAFSLNLPKCALWLDMGLGKTYTSITLAKLRHHEDFGNVNMVLVICPRSLIYQWQTEIHTLAPDAYVGAMVGSDSKKHKILDEACAAPFSFVITNYESLATWFHELDAIGFDMYILDEATKIKNPKAVRTLNTVELCNNIPYGVQLTGMAFVGNPLDIFSQFRAIEPGLFGDNQYIFSQKYIDYKIAPFGKYIAGYKNMDELKQRAYLYAFSRTKNRCLGLPAKVYQVRKLPINENQFKWYDYLVGQVSKNVSETISESLRGMSEDGGDTNSVTVEYIVSLVEKLTQVTSGFIKTDDGEFIWLDSPKYEETASIIRESDDIFIVWARHTYVLNKLEQYLTNRKLKVARLDRRSSDDMRRYVKEHFKNGEYKVLLLQIQSECRGNDFTCKTNPVSAIFFENTASIEERAQAEDRQHRIGMTGTAVYIDLVCEDTYDEGIMSLLSTKRSLSEYIREKNLDILLGKGGSVTKAKGRKATQMPKTPQEVEKAPKEYALDWDGKLDGWE